MSQDRARGLQGPQGVTGPVGPTGSIGLQGATGLRGPTGPVGGIYFVSGTAVMDFGSTPGTNITTTTISGQTGIQATSQVFITISTSSTATHNVVEHTIAPIKLVCSEIVPGVSFTISAITDWRLDGTFNVSWFWY